MGNQLQQKHHLFIEAKLKMELALSILIVNIWIYLLWHYVSGLRRTSRQVFSKLFTLKQMLEFLRQTVDRTYGVVCEVYLLYS